MKSFVVTLAHRVPGNWISRQTETFTPEIRNHVVGDDPSSALCGVYLDPFVGGCLTDSHGNRVYPDCARCAAILAMRIEEV